MWFSFARLTLELFRHLVGKWPIELGDLIPSHEEARKNILKSEDDHFFVKRGLRINDEMDMSRRARDT